MTSKKIYVIPYGHQDLAYKYRPDRMFVVHLDVLLRQIELAKENRDFRFVHDSLHVLKWLQYYSRHPREFSVEEELETERIAALKNGLSPEAFRSVLNDLLEIVREDRAEIVGQWVILLSAFTPEEIIIRSAREAKRFAREQKIDMDTWWNVDVMMSSQVVQIARSCGYKWIVGQREPLCPRLCLWASPDGTTLPTLINHYEGRVHKVDELIRLADEVKQLDDSEAIAKKISPEVFDQTRDLLLMEEHKLGPLVKITTLDMARTPGGETIFFLGTDIHTIQEDANTLNLIAQFLNSWKSSKAKEKKRVILSTMKEFMRIAEKELTKEMVIKQDPQGYLRPWTYGCYYDPARIRISGIPMVTSNEFTTPVVQDSLARTAESLSIMAHLEGMSYPGEEIKRIWELAVYSSGHAFWQEHKHLKPRIVAETLQIHRTIMKRISGFISRRVNTSSFCNPIIVVNTLPWQRTEPVGIDVETELLSRGIKLVDAQNKEVPFQVEAVPSFETHIARIVFVAKVPAFGYTCYSLEKNAEEKCTVQEERDGLCVLDNNLIRINFNSHGLLTAVEKKSQYRFLQEALNTVSYRESSEGKTDSFGYSLFCPVSVKSTAQRSLISKNFPGPVKNSVQTIEKLEDGKAERTVTLYQGCPWIETTLSQQCDGRIPVTYTMTFPIPDKSHGQTLLERTFHLLPTIDKAGPAISRNSIHYRTEKGGVSLNSTPSPFYFVGKTRWNKKKLWYEETPHFENIILRCIGSDHPLSSTTVFPLEEFFRDTNYSRFLTGYPSSYQADQSGRGKYEHRWRITPHAGTFDPFLAWKTSLELNTPLFTWQVEPRDGKLPPEKSFLESGSENILITAIAGEEAGDVLLRMFEAGGRKGKCTINFGFETKKCQEVDLQGKPVKQIPHKTKSKLLINLGPHQIKTLRITPARGNNRKRATRTGKESTVKLKDFAMLYLGKTPDWEERLKNPGKLMQKSGWKQIALPCKIPVEEKWILGQPLRPFLACYRSSFEIDDWQKLYLTRPVAHGDSIVFINNNKVMSIPGKIYLPTEPYMFTEEITEHTRKGTNLMLIVEVDYFGEMGMQVPPRVFLNQEGITS